MSLDGIGAAIIEWVNFKRSGSKRHHTPQCLAPSLSVSNYKSTNKLNFGINWGAKTYFPSILRKRYSTLRRSAVFTMEEPEIMDQMRETLTWLTVPDLPRLTGSTIPTAGRRFFIHSPSTILNFGTVIGEVLTTRLAHDVLGSTVPQAYAYISIIGPPATKEILITRMPGRPVVEIWPELGLVDREKVKKDLVALLVRMRERRSFEYYGRPGSRPYVTSSEFGGHHEHVFCHSRADWDASRIRALSAAAADMGLQDDRVRTCPRAYTDRDRL